eukprot:gene11717-12938_t
MNASAILLALSFLTLSALCLADKRLHKVAIEEDIHEKLSPVELKRIFGTEDRSKVPKFKFIHPITVGENARPSKDAQKTLHETRPVFINFQAFGLDFHLSITRNTKHISANQVIEYHNDAGITRIEGKAVTSSIGKLVSDPASKVVLDHTGGLSGMIQRKEGTFIISPLPSHIAETERRVDSHGAHVIYRRSVASESSSCGVKRAMQDSQRTPLRSRRATVTTRKAKTMELMIVADVNMIKYYGKEFLHTYMINQGNLINSFYNDPSLSYPINVHITRVVLLEKDVFAGATDMKDLLAKFHAWLSKNNPKDDSDPLHADNAVLYTRGGCANGCSLSGYASVGMCGAGDSVVKDSGLMTAITAAHEIGHNLGLDHDSTKGYESCANGINIMAISNTIDGRAFEWSKCSSERLATYLQLYSYCFDDVPKKSVAADKSNNTLLFGKVYNANKQCELALGKGYQHCVYYASRCQALTCETKSSAVCNTAMYPAAHGTWCGPNKWCIYGECVRDGTFPPKKVDGGWTKFSDHLPCNRPCGGGATWRTRTCTNPAPKNGGKPCKGDTISDRKICNMQACPSGKKSFRQDQCAAISPEKFPQFSSSQPCKLICQSPGQAAWFYGNVKDGTIISSTRICLNGVARDVGCDLKLESGAIKDRCGVCGGTGSTCKRIFGKDPKHYSNDGEQHELFTIPKGSWGIIVQELGASGRYLGLKVGSSNNLAYGYPSWSTTVTAAGTKVIYTMEDYDYPDKITIPGRINDKIRIFYTDYYGYPALGLKWSYFVSVEGDVSSLEYLIEGTWGACSKTCAGGTQKRTIKCRRTDDKSLVSPTLCPSANRPASVQTCNTHACPAEWHVYPWTKCSKSCGGGQRTRLHTCSELRADSNYHTVADSSCKKVKPSITTKEKCNAFDCLAEWKPGAWSPCSTTCDAGIRKRNVTCSRTKADGSVIVAHTLECSAMLPSIPQTEACNLKAPCSGWVIKYKPCSKTCGGGNKAMILHCKDSNGKIASNSICAMNKTDKPQQKKCIGLPACAKSDSDSKDVEYHLLGCYKDTRFNRRVPVLLRNFRDSIDWNNMTPTVKKCALLAASKSYEYFAIQFYGECWAGKTNASKHFYVDGPSDNCYQGTGGRDVNFVYRFGKLKSLPPILPAGCYNSTFKQLVKSFKGDIDWTKPIDESQVTKIASDCAIAAGRKGFAAFALKYPGECWSGPLAAVTYSRGGPSDGCSSLLGGKNAYYVYKLVRGMLT